MKTTCKDCPAEPVTRCQDCGSPLCATHRTLARTELGEWSRCRACGRRLAYENSWAGRWARRHQHRAEAVEFYFILRLAIVAVFALAALLASLTRIF